MTFQNPPTIWLIIGKKYLFYHEIFKRINEAVKFSCFASIAQLNTRDSVKYIVAFDVNH